MAESLADSARGRGVARQVLDTLEAKARELGISTLRLETNKALHEAQALYWKSGYQEVAPFNDEPYAHHWCSFTELSECVLPSAEGHVTEAHDPHRPLHRQLRSGH